MDVVRFDAVLVAVDMPVGEAADGNRTSDPRSQVHTAADPDQLKGRHVKSFAERRPDLQHSIFHMLH